MSYEFWDFHNCVADDFVRLGSDNASIAVSGRFKSTCRLHL